MGGKALKNVVTRRHTTDELFVAAHRIMTTIAADYDPSLVTGSAVPAWYSTKETHGDLDILVFATDTRAFSATLRAYLHERFGAAEIYHNGDVWSFNYGELQVDLNLIDAINRDMATVWFSFNDLSILLGRLYRYWHLKWAPDGLQYTLYGERRDIKLGELHITRDPRRALEILGYDWERYRQGFATVEDVYAYVVSSPLFTRDCCNPDYINNNTKLRDAKRENVGMFDDWVAALPGLPEYARPSHDDTIALIDAAVPEAQVSAHIARLRAEHEVRRAVSAKFNGGHLIEKFGIQGKAIGEGMDLFRAHFGGGYDRYILDTDYERILEDFRRIVVDAGA